MIAQIDELKSVVVSQAERIRQLERRIENMDRDLCASREAHDLLEFQMLEKEQNSRYLSSQLKEYNSHLEHQFMTQSRIVEAMKRKLAEQKVFADLIHKLAEINEAEVIQEHLENYIDSAESETKILAENFSRIIQILASTSSDSWAKSFPSCDFGALLASEGCEQKARRKPPIAPESQHDSSQE